MARRDAALFSRSWWRYSYTRLPGTPLPSWRLFNCTVVFQDDRSCRVREHGYGVVPGSLISLAGHSSCLCFDVSLCSMGSKAWILTFPLTLNVELNGRVGTSD